MKSLVILTSVLLVCLREHNVFGFSLSGQRVFVVTPSPRPLQIDEGRSGPFYYHNWMRRMDNDKSQTTSTTMKATTKVKTPDLIFAEFESDSNSGMKKTLRKLLEKEKVMPKTTTSTTLKPIFVPDEEEHKHMEVVNYGIPVSVKQEKETLNASSSDPIDYYSMYNDWYKSMPSPVFLPSTTPPPTSTKTSTTTITTPDTHQVENIWHIIDSERNDQDSGNWEEVSLVSDHDKLPINNNKTTQEKDIGSEIDENFALPGFDSNAGNGAENESRAVRYEPNIRFPYINLKPFQLKPSKKLNTVKDVKNSNNLMGIDNFHDLKNPVRGEAQDVVPTRNVIDRYNPAQPYLPPVDYGTKVSKQNSIPTPSKATANLVPPPPPAGQPSNDFPDLINSYESFPPYPSSSFDSDPPSPPRPAPQKPISVYSSPALDTSDDSGIDFTFDTESDDNPPIDNGPYKHLISPAEKFIPTAPPTSKPFFGYSYDKPPMPAEIPMPAEVPSEEDTPVYGGYHYDKPELPPPEDHKPPSFEDHGFPSDFPVDTKYHHYFDDHDFDHHYHHHHHTTTTTTEMPRVNRYSYYYLGKKLYYLPLYFSVYFIVYVGALIIKAVLRHKIVYPNSWRPNTTTSTFFSKRSVDAYLSNDNLHEVTGRVTHAIATAAEKYLNDKSKNK